MGCADLDALEEKARAATSGPWFAGHYAGWEVSQNVPGIAMPTIAHVGVEFFGKAQNASNADYIAAASPDVVLALIERVRVAEKALALLSACGSANCGRHCPVKSKCVPMQQMWTLGGGNSDAECMAARWLWAVTEARRSLGLPEVAP